MIHHINNHPDKRSSLFYGHAFGEHVHAVATSHQRPYWNIEIGYNINEILLSHNGSGYILSDDIVKDNNDRPIRLSSIIVVDLKTIIHER